MAIYLVYGTDVTFSSTIEKGNFDQLNAEVENLSRISNVFVFTKDSTPVPCNINGKVEHLYSKFFALPDTLIGKLVGSLVFSIVGVISLIKHAKEVHVVVSQGTISLQGGIANLVFKKPHILFLQYFAFNEQIILKRKFLGHLFRPVELFSIKHSSVVIAPNEKLRNEALILGAKKVKIIPNFVDIKEIEKISNKDILRKRIGFNDHLKLILFVGRLHPVKNVDLLLKAFKQISVTGDFILEIVGDGVEKGRLMEIAESLGIKDKVHFEGFKPKQTIFELMKASDVFVLPSAVEGQPRVILEAWACGLPIVASKVKGIENLINDGVDGSLFPLPSSELLAKAIINALEEDVASRFRTNGQKRAQEYNMQNILFRQREVVKQYYVNSN